MDQDSAKKQLIIRSVNELMNSKAGDKLASAVQGLVQLPHNIVDYIAGPERVKAIHSARTDGLLAEARAQAEIERLRAETGEFVFDREMRRTMNRRAILEEAGKALPPPSTPVSDEPVSKDFVHNFFDEFDGISDPEVHKIVGRLLANEVVRPGSFPRRTMRVLRDLDSPDFANFSQLCSLCWSIGELTPLVYEPNNSICAKHALNFAKFTDLESLGLITFGPLSGFAREGLPSQFNVAYGNIIVQLTLADGSNRLDIGYVMLTDAGRRLAPLTQAPLDLEFLNYIIEKWKLSGHKTTILGIANPPQAA